MIEAALIGLGWWGRVHLRSVQGISERIRYRLGVTKAPDEARALAEEYGLPLATEYDDALCDPAVEAVVLATPHSLHAAQIVAAAEAGKHVFCEKPFTLTRADAARALGSDGTAECFDDQAVRVHMRGGEPETRRFDAPDAVRAEIEAFADAIEGRAPYPIADDQIVHNIAVLEAIARSAATHLPVAVER